MVIAHVHNSGHFVLLLPSPEAGSEGTFEVLDPYYNTSSYPYANISDVIHYRVSRTDGAMSYPTYKQCDKQWGDDDMGVNNQTVCQASLVG